MEGVANLFNTKVPYVQRLLGVKSKIHCHSTMEEEDEENMYAPAEIIETGEVMHAANGKANALIKKEGRTDEEDGEEEGEEVEEDESDSVGAAASDILFIILTALQ